MGRAAALGGPRFQAGEGDPAGRPARPTAGAGCLRQRRRRHPRDGESRAARLRFPPFSAVFARAGTGGPRSRESARCGRRWPAVARCAELEQRLLGRLAEGPEARALVGQRLAEEGHEEGADAAAPGEALSAALAGRARAPVGVEPLQPSERLARSCLPPPAPGLGRDPARPLVIRIVAKCGPVRLVSCRDMPRALVPRGSSRFPAPRCACQAGP